MKIEHEYARCGAWAYLAALDVNRVKLFGRCEPKSGIAPFDSRSASIAILTLLAAVSLRLPFVVIAPASSPSRRLDLIHPSHIRGLL